MFSQENDDEDFLDPFEGLSPEQIEEKLLREYVLPALNVHGESRKKYAAFIKENKLDFFDKPRYRDRAWIPYSEVKIISIQKGISITQARQLRDAFNEILWNISDTDPFRTHQKLVKKALKRNLN